LYISEKDHAGGAPVLDRVGKDIDVHERTPGLARSELAQLVVGMAESESSLAGIDDRSEEFFKDRRQRAVSA
jgi:hypothetical protein